MEQLKLSKGLCIFEGIIFIILGLLAMLAPVIFTFGIELTFGILLVIGGLVQGYRSYTLIGKSGFYTTILTAILSLIIGTLFIANPLKGVLALTMLLMLYFFISGIFKIIMSFELQPMRGWAWMLVSGILAIVLGAIIYSGWPSTALWVIGLLLGIDMLFFGISLFSLSCAIPNHPKE